MPGMAIQTTGPLLDRPRHRIPDPRPLDDDAIRHRWRHRAWHSVLMMLGLASSLLVSALGMVYLLFNAIWGTLPLLRRLHRYSDLVASGFQRSRIPEPAASMAAPCPSSWPSTDGLRHLETSRDPRDPPEKYLDVRTSLDFPGRGPGKADLSAESSTDSPPEALQSQPHPFPCLRRPGFGAEVVPSSSYRMVGARFFAPMPPAPCGASKSPKSLADQSDPRFSGHPARNESGVADAMAVKELSFDTDARKSLLAGVEKLSISSQEHPRPPRSKCHHRQELGRTQRSPRTA